MRDISSSRHSSTSNPESLKVATQARGVRKFIWNIWVSRAHGDSRETTVYKPDRANIIPEKIVVTRWPREKFSNGASTGAKKKTEMEQKEFAKKKDCPGYPRGRLRREWERKKRKKIQTLWKSWTRFADSDHWRKNSLRKRERVRYFDLSIVPIALGRMEKASARARRILCSPSYPTSRFSSCVGICLNVWVFFFIWRECTKSRLSIVQRNSFSLLSIFILA